MHFMRCFSPFAPTLFSSSTRSKAPKLSAAGDWLHTLACEADVGSCVLIVLCASFSKLLR
eukprot:450608-Pyramimonas_sp.AAC.1